MIIIMENNIEKRFSSIESNEESRTIKGTAIVFNSQSEQLNGEFTEVIEPTAITQEIINDSDIIMKYQHDSKIGVLARSKKGKGTLRINITPNSVNYEFEAPNTTLGNDLLESIRRGDITSSSFAFTVSTDGQKWEKRNGSYLRTITKINKLYDFSIVDVPAYSETSVSVRGLEELKEQELKELEKQKEIEKQKEELKEYYNDLRNKINKI